MAAITAGMVKELRDKTGAGMMDCKTALSATDGNIEAAIDWLRTKGLAKAAKKAGRVAAEGLVAVAVAGHSGVVVEVNSETDFVARNLEFQALAHGIADVALERGGDVEALLGASLSGRRHRRGGDRQRHRHHRREHDAAPRRLAQGLGRRDRLLCPWRGRRRPRQDRRHRRRWNRPARRDELAALGRQLAMHVAATNPVALDLASVDPEVLAREKAILAEKNAGKPANVLEKITESGLKSYAKEYCLLEQAYIHDGSKSVAQVLKEIEGKVGAPVKLTGFARFALGEGIEKEETGFRGRSRRGRRHDGLTSLPSSETRAAPRAAFFVGRRARQMPTAPQATAETPDEIQARSR